MVTVNESVRGFVQTNPRQVKRNGESYEQTRVFAHRVLKLAVFTYRRLEKHDQTARLLRDVMDFMLRRYHGYCIKENIGAHYREVGVAKKDCDFEHVIPANLARELMLANRLTIEQAMNIPTCLLSKSKHRKLNSTRLGKQTPDIVNFWNRYTQVFPDIKLETHNGIQVDTGNWDLEQHYKFFNISTKINHG